MMSYFEPIKKPNHLKYIKLIKDPLRHKTKQFTYSKTGSYGTAPKPLY